jgi:hypothetical protein
MTTFGQTPTPSEKPTSITQGQIVQRITSRLHSIESAVQAIGEILGTPGESGSIAGSVFARLAFINGKLTYELANAQTNRTLLSANGKHYYDPTMFDAGVIDRHDQSTNVRLALVDVDQTVAALGTQRYAGSTDATTDDYSTYSLASGNINTSSKQPLSIPRHLEVLRNDPYTTSTNRSAAYDPEAKFSTPNRIVRHGATVKEAIEAINEAIGDVGESTSFQYMGTFSVDWIQDNSTIKACFQQIATKVNGLEVGEGADLTQITAQLNTNTNNISTNAASITIERTARENAVTTLDASLTTETNARVQSDTTIEASVVTETNRATGRENELESKIEQEKTSRTNAINTVTSQLNTETNTRIQKDTELEAAITSERTRAETAEASLQTNIDAVVGDVTNNENTIGQHLTLIQANQASTSTNSGIIDENKNRSTNNATGIASNTTLIGNETTRATGTEAELSSKINQEISDRENAINGVITNSVNPLQTLTATHTTSIQNNTNTIQTQGETIASNYSTLDNKITATNTVIGQLDTAVSATIGNLNDLSNNVSSSTLVGAINNAASAVSGAVISLSISAAAGKYVFTGDGFPTSTDNPTLHFARGQTYHLEINATGHPFHIKTTNSTGTDNQYQGGVTNNGIEAGTVTITVPMDAPSTLYYNCQYHSSMNGTISVVNASEIHASIQQNVQQLSSLETRIDNVISNTDPAALDSLSEIVQAYTAADTDLQTTISNNISGQVGSLATLATDNQSTIVHAINEIHSDVANIAVDVQSVSSTSNSNTTAIGNEVSRAQNKESELESNINSNTTQSSANATAIGTLGSLTTSTTSNLVGAINEVVNTVSLIDSSSGGDVSQFSSQLTALENQVQTLDTTSAAERQNIRNGIGQTSQLATDTTTSIVGAINEIHSDVATIDSVQSLPWNGHLIPTETNQYDIGSAEKRLRLLFVQNDSLWIGDEHQFRIHATTNVKSIRRRVTQMAPSAVIALGGTFNAAAAHANVLGTNLRLEHWLAYYLSLPNAVATATINDVFAQDSDFQEELVLDDISTLTTQLLSKVDSATFSTLNDLVGSASLDGFETQTVTAALNELKTSLEGVGSNSAIVQNTTDIAANNTSIQALQSSIGSLGTNIASNNTSIQVIRTSITPLETSTSQNSTTIQTVQSTVGTDSLSTFTTPTITAALNELQSGLQNVGSNSEVQQNTQNITTLTGIVGDGALSSAFSSPVTLTSAINELQTGVIDNETIQQNTTAIALNTQSINNLLQNTDQVALNSLAEIVADYTASDQSLQTVISNQFTGQIGDLNTLQTSASTLVSAINGVDQRVAQNTTSIGSSNNLIASNTAAIAGNASNIATKANQTALDTLSASVVANTSALGTKANQTALDAIASSVVTNTSTIGTKANQTTLDAVAASVTANTSTLGTKADQTGLDNLTATANQHSTSIASNTTGLGTKASQVEVDALSNTISSNTSAIGANASTIASNTSTIASETAAREGADAVLTTQVSVVNTKLGSGTLSSTFTNPTLISAVNELKTSLDGVGSNDAILQNTAAISANTQSINNLLQNTDQVALNSLAEIVSDYQASDSSLQAAITAQFTGQIGAMGTLNTSEQATLVGAINEVRSEIVVDGVNTVGSLSTLATPASNLVTAINALDTSTSQNTTNISANSTAINTKASQNALDTLSGTVSSNTSLLATKANTDTVTTLDGTVSTLSSRVTTLESTTVAQGNSISSNAASISSNTSASTTNNANITSNTNGIGTLTSQVSSIQTNVTANTNSINGKADLTALNAVATTVNNNTTAVNSQATAVATNTSSISSNTSAIGTMGDLSSTITSRDTLVKAVNHLDSMMTILLTGGGSGSGSSGDSAQTIINTQNITTLSGTVSQNTNAITANTTLIDTKANQSALETTNTNVSTNTANITSNTTAIAGKASQSDLTSLTTTVSTNTASISSNQTALSGKANKSELDVVSATVTSNTTAIGGKANQADVSTLQSTVSGHTQSIDANTSAIATKAPQSELTSLAASVSTNTTNINSKANQDAFDTLSTTVNSHTNLISSNGASIATKASQLDFNALNSVVSSNTTSISQKANQTSLDTLTTTVNGHTTSINANATVIAGKVAQTDFDTLQGTVSGHTNTLATKVSTTDFNALTSTVTNHTSSINSNTTAISTLATQADLTSLTSTVSANASLLTNIMDGTDTTTLDSLKEIVDHFTNADNTINGLITSLGTTKASQSEVDSLTTTVSTKASQSSVNSLTTTVNGHTATLGTKANQNSVDALQSTVDGHTTVLNTKASQGSLDALVQTVNTNTTTIDTKASQSDLNTLTNTVSGHTTSIGSLTTTVSTKAAQSAVDTLTTTVNGNTSVITTNATAIGTKASQSNVDTLTSTINGHTTSINANASAIATKAPQSSLDTLTNTVSGHTTSIATNTTAIATKAAQTVLDSLSTTVTANTTAIGTKSNQTDFDTLQTTVNQHTTSIASNTTTIGTKASQLDLNALSTTVTGNTTAIGTKVSQTDFDALNATVVTNAGNISTNATNLQTKASQADHTALSNTVSGIDTALSAETARAIIKENANTTLINAITTTTIPAVENNVSTNVTDIANINTLLGSGGLSTTSTTIKGGINEIVTTLGTIATSSSVTANTSNITTNTGSITSNTTAINTINALLGSTSLSTTQSTITAAINEVKGSVATEKTRAEAAEQTLTTNLSSEIARATTAENSINGVIGSTSMGTTATTLTGAIAELLSTITSLSAMVGILDALVRNQKTLVVSSNQDHRTTDLTTFSEIIVLGGNTLTITTSQAEAIRSKVKGNNETWILSFVNQGTVHAVHSTSTTLDITSTTPVFNSVQVEAGQVTMTVAQLQGLTVTKTNGSVIVMVTSNADLSSISLVHVTEMKVSAVISLTASQVTNVNMTMLSGGALTLMVPQTTNLTSSSSVVNAANSIVVSNNAKLILTASQASVHRNKITKQGSGTVEVHVTETLDVQTLTLDGVNTLVVTNATITMTPAQAEHFRNTLTKNSATVKILEAATPSNYTTFHVEQWTFDELILQNTTLTITPSQAHVLSTKTVHKTNSTITMHVSSTTNATLLNLSKVDAITTASNSVLTLHVDHMSIPITKGNGSTVVLHVNGAVNVSTITLSSVDSITVTSSGTLRLKPSQLNIPVNNSGTVILVVLTSGDHTSISTNLFNTIELGSNVQLTMTVTQLNGKSITKSGGATLVGTISGSASGLTLPTLNTLLVQGNSTINTTQYNAVAAVSKAVGASLTLAANNENITSIVFGKEDQVSISGTVTMTAAQYTNTTIQKLSGGVLNVLSTETINMTSKSLTPINSLTHSNGALTLTGSQMQTFSSLNKTGGTIVCHIVGDITHSSVLDQSTSIVIQSNGNLTYTANNNTDVATNTLMGKITNNGIFTMKNMYKAPTVSGTVVLPLNPVNGLLAWADTVPLNVGDNETINDALTDVHTATPTKAYQWQRDTGSGFVDISGATSLTYTIVNADVGAHIRVKASWAIDWMRFDGNNHYDANQPPVQRVKYSSNQFVNTSSSGTITKNGAAAAANAVQVDDTLSINIVDTNGVQTPTYVWKRNNTNTGITANTYVLKPIDFGKTISCTYSFTDGSGYPEIGTAQLGPLPTITASYPANTTVLDANASFPTVTLSLNTTAVSSQWFTYPHNGSKNNSLVYSGSTLFGQTGTYFYKRFTTDDGVVIDSTALPTKAYAPSGGIAITGILVLGETLGLTSTITDINYMTANNNNGDVQTSVLNKQWYRSDDANGTNKQVVATSSTYTIVQADTNKYIHVEATYVDGATSHSVQSLPIVGNVSGQISMASKTSTNRSIATTKMVTGDKLVGTVSDTDGINGSVTYQWKRGSNALSGQTSNTYTLVTADFSSTLTLEATYTDNLGRTQTVSSPVSFGSEPTVQLTNSGHAAVSGLLASPAYLSVSTPFIGLPYKIFVDGSETASGTVTAATGTAIPVANATGKTVEVRVFRTSDSGTSHDPIATNTVKFATVTIALSNGDNVNTATLGQTIEVTVTGTTQSFVEFFFDNEIMSHGTLGWHVLTAADSGNQMFARVRDIDGRFYISPTYTVPTF